MRRRPRGYCSICRVGYTSWAAHAATAGHRAKAYRAANPSSTTRKGHKRLAREAATRRARRVERDPAEGTTRVKAHRRRPPDDGPRYSVRVVKHRRGRPWRDYPAAWGLARVRTRNG